MGPSRGGREGGGGNEDFGARVHERLVERREAHVVADGQPGGPAGQIGDGDGFAGGCGSALGEHCAVAELDVEQVKLSIAVADRAVGREMHERVVAARCVARLRKAAQNEVHLCALRKGAAAIEDRSTRFERFGHGDACSGAGDDGEGFRKHHGARARIRGVLHEALAFCVQ